MLTKLGTVFVLVALFASAPLKAGADSYYESILPGVGCKLYNAQASDTFLDPHNLSANGLKNTSGSSQFVVCPIHKMVSDGTYSIDDIALVQGFLSASNATVSLYARSADATTWRNWSQTSILQYGNAWRYMLQGDFSTNDMSVSVYIYLPSGVYVNNIDVLVHLH